MIAVYGMGLVKRALRRVVLRIGGRGRHVLEEGIYEAGGGVVLDVGLLGEGMMLRRRGGRSRV